jgi:soluble lytic murein transglycosylase-like protein
MLEDLGAIQARISEIQDRIAALRPNAATEVNPTITETTPPAATFNETLQRAQTSGATAHAAASSGETTPGVSVPPASLGPLPPLPVSVAPVTPIATPTTVSSTGTGQYAGLIQTYAAKHGLAPNLVRAVIQTESGGNAHAVSPAGAMGLMQLMPANVQEAGISNAFDPEQNIAAGTQQLSGLLKEYGGDLDMALAGYNAGPGNVRKYGGVPPFRETQNYIRKVRAAMEQDGG